MGGAALEGTPPPALPSLPSAEARVGVLLKGLRAALSALLADKIAAPRLDISGHPVVEAILRLLTQSM